jgi:hypothetical protein
MLGFHAEYAGGDIVVQEDEIAEARFFHYNDLPQIPPQGSIAHALIQDFVALSQYLMINYVVLEYPVIDLLLQYGLFLAKTATVLIALLVVIVAVSNVGQRRRPSDEGDIDVVYLNDRLRDYGDVMRESVLDKHALKRGTSRKSRQTKKRQRTKECKRCRIFSSQARVLCHEFSWRYSRLGS